jgi:hypothetical protein
MWKIPEFSMLNLYRLARSLTPQSSIWESLCEDTGGHLLSPDRVGSLRTLGALVDYSLAVIPLPSIWELPLEIRVCIWEHVGILTPLSAFLLVAGETSRLASHIHCPVSRKVVLKPGSYLSAKMVTVFGTEYVQDLTTGEESQVSSKVSGVILGLKFAACLSGICAIKAIGRDWETDWVGKIPRIGRVWYGMICGTGYVFYFNYSVSFHLV